MTPRLALILATAGTWPRFTEVQQDVLYHYQRLPIFDTLHDLQTAYAMAVWDKFRFDWQASL